MPPRSEKILRPFSASTPTLIEPSVMPHPLSSALRIVPDSRQAQSVQATAQGGHQWVGYLEQAIESEELSPASYFGTTHALLSVALDAPPKPKALQTSGNVEYGIAATQSY